MIRKKMTAFHKAEVVLTHFSWFVFYDISHLFTFLVIDFQWVPQNEQ